MKSSFYKNPIDVFDLNGVVAVLNTPFTSDNQIDFVSITRYVERAIEMFQKIIPILAFSHQHVDISIHFNKRFYYKQGIFQTDKTRDPIIPFNNYHQKVADELIQAAIELEDATSHEK